MPNLIPRVCATPAYKHMLAGRLPYKLNCSNPDEWFTINKLVTAKIANYSTIHHAIERGAVQTQLTDDSRPFIHRDELNRFLQESPVSPKSIRENIQPRIEITYTPIFTGVQSSWG